MNPADEARKYADSVLALIPQLAQQAVEERRTNACFYELVARHRLTTCRPIMRPWWRWQLKRHGARCAANKQLASECAMARARVRMQEGAA
jgi:hypothetical protein